MKKHKIIVVLAMVMLVMSLTLVACVTEKSFRIEFDTQGGTTVADIVLDDADDTYAAPINPEKAQYTFTGWSTISTVYEEWDFSEDDYIAGGTIKVYAIWEKVPEVIVFTVEFDMNGGMPAESTQIVEEGGKVAKPDEPTKKGYIFESWYLDDAEFDFYSVVIVDSVVSAKWVANKYTLRYNSNRGDAIGIMENSVHTYDSEKALTSNSFSSAGNSFLHWNTSADDTGTSYIDGESVKNIIASNNEIIDLYAIWEENFNYTLKSDDTYEVVGLNKSGVIDMTIPMQYNQKPVTSIGKNAFTGQITIKNVILSNGIERISERAFEDCLNLESIIIPESVKFIDIRPFENCNKLFIYTEVESAPPFDWCDSWNEVATFSFRPVQWGVNSSDIIVQGDAKYVLKEGNALLAQYMGNESSYKIDAYITYNDEVYDIISIGRRAFENKGLSDINIPNGLQRIGAKAFEGNTNLTNISFTDSVISIGDDAFNNTAWYMSQEDGVVYLKDWVIDFKGTMAASTNIVLKEGVKNIADSAFYGSHDNLTGIEFPESLVALGDGVFYGCSKLDNIIVPNSVISIGANAFASCSGMKTLSLGTGLISLGESVFFNCSSLKVVDLPNELSSIGASAFVSCTSLTSISIPDGVTVLEDGVFGACTNLTTIDLPNGLTNIGYTTFHGTAIVELIIPSSVEYIGQMAFYNCVNLSIYFESSSPSSSWHSYWDYLAPESIYWYRDLQPAESGKYWHYVEEIVTKW